MSLLFRADLLGHPLHVLEIRGRAAFLAHEIGAAAGHGDHGNRLLDVLLHVWATAFEEDEDLAFLDGRDLARVRRETGLPYRQGRVLVLFPRGVEKALDRSDARYAGILREHLERVVYPRVAEFYVSRSATRAPAPQEAPPGASRANDLRGTLERLAFERRVRRYEAIRRFAELLRTNGRDPDAWLNLERVALETLLGRAIDPETEAVR